MSNAPITDADRETARLAVSMALKNEEAAWHLVAQLIADYRVLNELTGYTTRLNEES